ncbi:MAG: hypothetical protein WCR12_08760, partial [Dysgonamonadaceae bacterium]
AAVKADLQAKYDELTAQMATLRTDLDNLTANLAALDLRVTTVRQEMVTAINDLDDELSGLIFDVYNSLDKRVTALTFIPEYTSEDGTPQIVVRGITEWAGPKYRPSGTPKTSVYWDEIQEDGVIYKGITILRYNVSPSNASMSDFEIANLLNQTTLVRSMDTKSDYVVLSGDATYANGVLSVPVAVEVNSYDLTDGSWGWIYAANGSNKDNVSVALQVRNLNAEYDNEEDRLVTSTEYVKANFDLSEGRIALNEKSEKDDGTILPVDITFATIAGESYASDIKLWNGKSQSGNMTDVLDHTINLNDFIYGVFDDFYGDWSEMSEFGFNNHTFKFRLVPLGTEGVDQSYDYLNFNGTTGVIGVKPAGNTVNQAAVGRTPVVEVTALVNGKVHAVGFIKLIVTDEFDNSPIEFTFNLQDFVLNCNATHQLTNVDIEAIDFDQIFNNARIQLGKDAFFTEYNQHPITTEIITAPAGALASHITFTWAIDPETQSVNLYNYIKGEISNQAPVGTYEVKTTLKSNGYRPDVVIYWTFKVLLPTGIVLTPNQVFYKDGGIVVNPSILEQGSKSSTVYETLLNNTFVHNELNFDFGTLQGNQQCDAFLTPYFVFTGVPDGFYVTDNGTVVRQGSTTGLIAARIIQDGKKYYVHLNDQYTASSWAIWGKYRPWSEASKALVKAGWVNVQPRAYINGQPSNVINLYDPFKVKFIYPLQFVLPTNLSVYDQANDGVKNIAIMDVNNPSRVKDWNNKLLIFNGANWQLLDHYEISVTVGTIFAAIDFDLDNLSTNLSGGVPTEGVTNGPLPFGSSLKINTAASDVETVQIVNSIPGPLYITADVMTKFAFEWKNSDTGAVQNEFKVFVPASLKHKWGTLNGTLVVTVKPGNGN